MRLWLDDLRPMPEDFDKHARTADEAIDLLNAGGVEHISFDHDLGDQQWQGSGYEVAEWIEREAFYGTIVPLTWQIHSANPVGRDKIRSAMLNAERFWADRAAKP